MKPIELKITRIGNSHGIRIPAETLKRYRIGSAVVMEQRSDGIFLRPTGPAVEKLSWDETAREMQAASEDWSDWDSVSADGLNEIPWEPARSSRVAEPKPSYQARRKKKRT
ncbi:MAG TPA: AbrB/MazE/SpoVT family DNA-binding domain-containing protein [Gemmatimonadaceae bacterium]